MSQPKGNLLIVEDEAELREAVASILSDIADNITEAANAQEAIDLMKTQSFDAILSDQRMPLKSGLDFLRWLRAEGLETPLVIHTGFGDQQLYAEAKALGVFSIVEKPWIADTMINVMTKALAVGRQQRKP